MDFQKKIEEYVNDAVKDKVHFDILFVSDESSRLSFIRGAGAMTEFKHFYGHIAPIKVTTMDSATFVESRPDLSKYNVLWVDNVANGTFNNTVLSLVDELMEKLAPNWKADAANLSAEEKEAYIEQANEFRSMSLRIIYGLDEFVWDAPGGRQVNMITVTTVEDAMSIADEVIVPNAELAGAVKEIGFVHEKKEVLVIPTFMTENFYPVGKIFLKSTGYSTSIRTPKVLVKGTVIPQNVQNLIIHGTDKYDFTVCSVGELDERLVKLIQDRTVHNIQHWANPFVSKTNAVKTAAIERDAGFDFVIHTMGGSEPDDVKSDYYNITAVDTDALMSIASGAVAIAGIDDAGYDDGMHICKATGMTFGVKTSVKDLDAMLSKWKVCVNWDNIYEKQRQLLSTKLLSSPVIMASYFNAMLGRRIADARKEYFKKAEAAANADIKESK